MKEITCSICYEIDNYYSVLKCQTCINGCICLECEDEMGFIGTDYIVKCPLCRTDIGSSNIVKQLIDEIYCIIDETNNILIQRWIDNYKNIDIGNFNKKIMKNNSNDKYISVKRSYKRIFDE